MRPATQGLALHGTTILGVSRDGKAAMASDGQVSLGETSLKQTARKVRRLAGGEVLVGFAGAVADSLTLLERFEAHLAKHPGRIERAAVDLAKEWRTNRNLSRLNAMLAVVDRQKALLIIGSGEVLESEDGVVAAGSGGAYALAAARALLRHTRLTPPEIVREGLTIAADICIYTNAQIFVEVLE
jgi:ATP-dependent HslUV protease subunit HslV